LLGSVRTVHPGVHIDAVCGTARRAANPEGRQFWRTVGTIQRAVSDDGVNSIVSTRHGLAAYRAGRGSSSWSVVDELAAANFWDRRKQGGRGDSPRPPVWCCRL